MKKAPFQDMSPPKKLFHNGRRWKGAETQNPVRAQNEREKKRRYSTHNGHSVNKEQKVYHE